MRLLLIALLGMGLAAQTPTLTAYVTRPQTWRLEVKGAPGGWTTRPKVDLTLRVVDPTDPSPPKEGTFVDPERPLDGGDGEDAVEEKDLWDKRPSTTLLTWFNGEKREFSVPVGHPMHLTFDVQNGEIRLEVMNPESGRRSVRTWWSSNSRSRLLVRLTEDQVGPPTYWGGALQVVEPDHTESIAGEATPSGGRSSSDRYEHASPLPGTYTVRWFDPSTGVDGYEWGSAEYGGQRRPLRVVVEIFLDPGTDVERRWRFERLVSPGTRRVTLGSFDIED